MTSKKISGLFFEKLNNKVLFTFMCIFTVGVLLCGCTPNIPAAANAETSEASSGEDETPTDNEELRASDVAVVIDVDTDNKSIILQTAENGARYKLVYDGKTNFANKYGDIMTAAQVERGDIVNVTLSIHSKTLLSMQEAENVFTIRDQKKYEINKNRHTFSVGEDTFKLPNNLVVIMDGQVGSVDDITENDVITVHGIDRQVFSVTIDEGHGYLKVRGEDAFIGGWLEIGSIIKPITENMRVLVPEGDYELRISYHGRGGTKAVHIERDEETSVDVSDLKDSILQMGTIQFDIDPPEAKLKINGEPTEWVVPIELEYGVYRIDVECKNYIPVQSFLSVGKKTATIEINLEEDGSSEKDESSSQSQSSTSSSDKSASGVIASSSVSTSSSTQVSANAAAEMKAPAGRLYIYEPADVEVYFDGSYKGIAPVSFEKQSGTHVITLRKSGYKTKSYTVTLGNESSDEEYNFNALVSSDEEEEED